MVQAAIFCYRIDYVQTGVTLNNTLPSNLDKFSLN